MTPSTDARSGDRLAWPDVARGLSVTLIVVLHLWATHLTFWLGDQTVTVVLAHLIEWTSPLRIPLFFFVSGYLASRALQRPWRSAWRGRVFSIAYLYVLWVAIIAVFLWADNAANGYVAESPVVMLVRNVVSPESHMWYLWALIVLFIAVWVTKAVPPGIVVGIGAVVSIVAPFVLDQPYRQVASATLFYVLGARLPAVADWLTSRRSAWIIVAGSAVYVGSMLLGPTGPYGFADPLTSAVGVGAMIAVIGVIAHRRWMAIFRRIGRNTLPIFILNPLVFLLLSDLLRAQPDLAAWLADHRGAGAVYTLAVIAATLAVSIALKAAADRLHLGWLFAMPARWIPAPAQRT